MDSKVEHRAVHVDIRLIRQIKVLNRITKVILSLLDEVEDRILAPVVSFFLGVLHQHVNCSVLSTFTQKCIIEKPLPLTCIALLLLEYKRLFCKKLSHRIVALDCLEGSYSTLEMTT